jgi:hypothetical protein
MSAFVINSKTMDSILSIFENYEILNNCYFLKGELEIILNGKSLTELGKEFLKLNIESVSYRYNLKSDSIEYLEYLEYLENYFYSFHKYSLAQTIKSLDCLMYQSCELENYKENETYQKMEAMKKILIDALIYMNEDYQKASWGIAA